MSQDQKQPYDTTLKALLNKQTEEILAYILPEAQFVRELNSEVLKPQPPLRTDKIYLIFYRGEYHILHIEIETKGKSSMPYRMLSYYGLLLEQYKKPICYNLSVPSPDSRVTTRGYEWARATITVPIQIDLFVDSGCTTVY